MNIIMCFKNAIGFVTELKSLIEQSKIRLLCYYLISCSIYFISTVADHSHRIGRCSRVEPLFGQLQFPDTEQ